MELLHVEALLAGNASTPFSEQLLAASSQNVPGYQLLEELLTSTLNGHFETALSTSTAQAILGTANEDPCEQLEEHIQSQLVSFYETLSEDKKYTGQLAVLCIGVGCLHLFVQNNWVGPPTQSDATNFLPSKFREDDRKVAILEEAVAALSVDAYPVYHLSSHLLYLHMANIILHKCQESLSQCQTAGWWLMRLVQTQQALLEERSPTLFALVKELTDSVSVKEPLMTDEKYRNAQIQFHVEAGYLMDLYYEPTKSKEHFNTAVKLAGLQVELTGALGKRTRFQQTDLAQLVLEIKRSDEQEAAPSSKETNGIAEESSKLELPKAVSLDDDTVLNQIQFQNPDQSFSVPVTAVEQTVILALCHEHNRTHAGQGDILQEEILAYISNVISQPQNWPVMCKALLVRTLNEQDSSRRMERSMAQLEELVNQYENPTENPSCRLHLLYSSQLPPRWNIQKELANLLQKTGAVDAALEIYLRIQLWEDVIKCYQHLGRTEKAETVIREQLAIKETPSLWCYLGDVLQEEEYYIKSWELSDGRFARAQRALGYMRLQKGEFEKCVESFEKSLALNPLQLGVWFSYGCATMALQKYEEAAKAFRRCVTIHTDNFEAWSNLATAYIRSGQKPRAFKTLQEALKCEYENWRLWENYLVVATDCGEFSEVLQAYHRLLDLKDKYADAEVLGILVRAVNEDIPDAKGNPASHLRPKVQELLGRVTSKVTNDADIWRHYAKLLLSNSEATQTDRQRALQHLQKSHRSMTQAFNWEKDVSKCKDVMEKAVDLATTYLDVCEKVGDNTQAIQMLSSARLVLRGILTKVKQKHSDPVTRELLPELVEPHDKLDSELQKIVTRIDQLKGT